MGALLKMTLILYSEKPKNFHVTKQAVACSIALFLPNHMHPEVQQLAINILVLLTAILVPLLLVLGMWRALQILTSLSTRQVEVEAGRPELPKD